MLTTDTASAAAGVHLEGAHALLLLIAVEGLHTVHRRAVDPRGFPHATAAGLRTGCQDHGLGYRCAVAVRCTSGICRFIEL